MFMDLLLFIVIIIYKFAISSSLSYTDIYQILEDLTKMMMTVRKSKATVLVMMRVNFNQDLNGSDTDDEVVDSTDTGEVVVAHDTITRGAETATAAVTFSASNDVFNKHGLQGFISTINKNGAYDVTYIIQ
jgi:hypothetical protein